MRRGLAVAMLGIALLATACQTGSSAPPAARQTPAGGPSLWVAIDLPGTYSGDRAAAYDPSRNCLWIATRIWAEFAGDTEHATLTRLNLAAHSVVQTGLPLPARRSRSSAFQASRSLACIPPSTPATAI